MNSRLIPLALILVYIGIELSQLYWGIPGKDRIFLYHMDEWHQLMSIRALVREGTPNLSGAANGPILQFIISGIWAAPAILTKILDLDAIISPISGLDVQEKLFALLRLNTLFFGLATIYVLRVIMKKYLLVSRWFIGVFIFAPAWLFLSNYFKYDIALTFWVTASIWALLDYGRRKTVLSFLIAAIPVAGALATKVSALPLVLLYIAAYFLYANNLKKDWPQLSYGLTTILIIFCVVGIPDLIFFAKGEYLLFLYDNIVAVPARTANFILPMNFWVYLLLRQFPAQFGYGFSILMAGFALLHLFYRKRIHIFISKDEKLLFTGFVLFLVSLLPLQMYMVGNRTLVLFPFLFLLLSFMIKRIFAAISNNRSKNFLYLFIWGCIGLQIAQGVSALTVHWTPDPRQQASKWIVESIPAGSKVGIENIPVYQMLPDVSLREYYTAQYFPNEKTKHAYQIIDTTTAVLPDYVIISNVVASGFEKNSGKKEILKRLEAEHYTKRISFTPEMESYGVFNDERDFYFSGLPAMPTDITIYSRNSL